jgi:hypothetical protein
MAAAGGRIASTPLEPPPPPASLFEGGARLDGRQAEQFRNVCEFLPAALFVCLFFGGAVCLPKPHVTTLTTPPPHSLKTKNSP